MGLLFRIMTVLSVLALAVVVTGTVCQAVFRPNRADLLSWRTRTHEHSIAFKALGVQYRRMGLWPPPEPTAIAYVPHWGVRKVLARVETGHLVGQGPGTVGVAWF